MPSLRATLLAVLGLLAGLLALPCAVAQSHGEPAAPAASHAGGAAQDPGHAVGAHDADAHEKGTLEMTSQEIFNSLLGHSVPHVVWPHVEHGEKAPWYSFYTANKWQWISTVIVLLLMLNVASSFNRAGKPGWVTRVFRGWCRWIRDEMVYPVMGKEHGAPFVPYFLFLFFFVAGQNCIGLIPSVHGVVEPATATGTPYVTAPMAIITFGMMLVFGMRQNGVVGFWKGLLPHGLPAALIPLMVVVELVGLIVKPFALTVRLFANMLAGHLVIGSAVGLIFVFTIMMKGSAMSYATAVPAVGMAAFIYIIESFVVLLQAYIFTYLSIIFVHQAIHQEH